MVERIGQQFGNYQLTRLSGHGGFADVYLGEHIYLKTQAAIKILHAQVEPEDNDKFRAEAFTIAHLVHPHIIRVFDFDIENSIPFLVMDYAPNGSLRDRYPKGTHLSPQTFIPYVKQVASALQYAHDRKLIHRDVKPSNMLLGENDQVLLSDFGIALVAQNSHSQSTEDVIIGTMSYMAPEQIQGKPRPASDQYSLAVVVYEWLTGIKPFRGSYVEIVSQHLSAPPQPLHEVVASIPPAVEQVVLRALNKDPHKRFPSVQHFATALEQAYLSPPSQGMRSAHITEPIPEIIPPQSGRMVLSPPRVQQPAPPVQPMQPAQFVQSASNAPIHTETSRMPPMSPVPPMQTIQTIQTPPGNAPSVITTARRPVKKGLKILGRGVGTLIAVIVLCGLALCGGSYFAYQKFNPPPGVDTTGAITAANDFMNALSQRNYTHAYGDVSTSLYPSSSNFQQLEQSADRCYGPVTHYTGNNPTVQGNKVTYTYVVTRPKRSHPYNLKLTLQQNESGKWQITKATSDIDVGQPTCS